MEIEKLILSYILAVLSWPVITAVLVLYFLKTFKDPLEIFLNRVQKGEGFGIKLELGQIDRQKEAEAVSAVIPVPEGIQAPSTNNSLQDSASDAVKNFIDSFQANPELTGEGVITLTKAFKFEKSFNMIFGSQIQLLEHLAWKDEKHDSAVNLFSFYQTFRKLSPDPNATSYPDYLNFMVKMNLIRQSSKTAELAFEITDFGVEFLSYLQTNYGPAYKLKGL